MYTYIHTQAFFVGRCEAGNLALNFNFSSFQLTDKAGRMDGWMEAIFSLEVEEEAKGRRFLPFPVRLKLCANLHSVSRLAG